MFKGRATSGCQVRNFSKPGVVIPAQDRWFVIDIQRLTGDLSEKDDCFVDTGKHPGSYCPCTFKEQSGSSCRRPCKLKKSTSRKFTHRIKGLQMRHLRKKCGHLFCGTGIELEVDYVRTMCGF